MNSSSSNLERFALEDIERRFSAMGYTLVHHPQAALLPSFLGNFRPDAIAIGKSPNVIIEVMTRRGSVEAEATKIKQLQQLLDGQNDWKLEVVYTTPSTPPPDVATAQAIRRRFEEIKALAPIDRRATLIMSWSILEAVCRAALPDRAARPLSPGTAVEFLASLGYIMPSEAETLRAAARARNLIVHGDLGQEVRTALLDQVLNVIDALIGHLEAQATT